MKGNSPQFHGEYDPEAVKKWLQEVEKVFEERRKEEQGGFNHIEQGGCNILVFSKHD